MKITVKAGDPAAIKSQALAVFLFDDEKQALKDRPELAGLKTVIEPRLKNGDFKGEHLKTLVLFPEIKDGPERIILVGLGSRKEYSAEKIRTASAQAVNTAQELKLNELNLSFPPQREEFTAVDVTAEAMALGVFLGGYRFMEYKTRDRDKFKPLARASFIIAESKAAAKIRNAVKPAEITAKAVQRARDLVNRPANAIYPESLAAEAEKLAAGSKIKVTVMTAEDAEKKGMGAFLGVAQGSHRPGRIIIMEYNGGPAKEKPVALVGKAITFDSGGLSLKPADGMVTMKTDMSGGAAVMCTIAAAAEMGLKVNLVGVIPAAENMPGGKAYRPGDILTSYSGLTIEITNTDAEGRLILADGLTLALEYQPRYVIDVATLTGACVIALGEKCAGLMGSDQGLIDKLKKAGDDAGERVWQLPLFEDYFEGMKSDAADFKNSGPRYGGTITAALFLKQFVGKADWAHLDIAGPARAEKSSPDTPSGGTGFGVQLLTRFLRNM